MLWFKLAATLFAFMLAAYMAAAAGLWGILRYQRGLVEARFIDLLVPSRWEIHRRRTGDHLIARAKKQLEAGETRAALVSLRVGVAQSPANVPGRLLLAQLLIAAGRTDLAEQLLRAGLPVVGRDPAFLQAFFGLLLQQQKDAAVRACAQELLREDRLPAESVSLVALAAATASYFRGNYDASEDFIRAHRLDRSFDGRLLAAQVEWARGYRELALVRLRALAGEFPANDLAGAQLAAWLRAERRTGEFRRVTLLRQIAQPDNPAVRIDLLRAFREDDPARAARAAEALLREFPGDERIVLALADFAADTGDVALARKIHEHCRRQTLAREAAAFLTVEAMIVARDYRGALDFIGELLDSDREWARRHHALFNSLQAIAHCGLGDPAAAQLYLAKFLGQADLRADNLRAVAERLLAVGARAEARETLAHAVGADPLNQAALTRLIQLDLELGRIDALPANLRRLLAMRRPSPTVLRTALAQLGSDRFLFTPERDETLTALQQALANAPAISVAGP